MPSTKHPGEYAEIAYSIKELCTELEKFVASKSPTGAAAIGAAGRAWWWSVRVSMGMGVGAHPHEGVGAVAGVSPHINMNVAVTRL